jgi:hypothetical protein
MLVRALSVHIARETAGAARIRHSLRPLSFEGEDFRKTSGASRGEIAKLCFSRHCEPPVARMRAR